MHFDDHRQRVVMLEYDRQPAIGLLSRPVIRA
jgi:hypothetical protein